MPTGMSSPFFMSATSRNDRSASQANNVCSRRWRVRRTWHGERRVGAFTDEAQCEAAQNTLSPRTMIVRISKGAYPAHRHDEITARLAVSSSSLVPAIRALPGCISYYVGADAASATMVNVSVWDTLEHANAMSSLAPMLALAGEFVALGVEFERPIINYPVLWQLP